MPTYALGTGGTQLDTDDTTGLGILAGTDGATLNASLDDFPVMAVSVDTARFSVIYFQNNRADDTLGLSIRIMNGTTVMAAADAGGTAQVISTNVTSTTDVSVGPTAFSYVNTGASIALWNGASVQFVQAYATSMGNDDAQVAIDYVQIDGDYTEYVAPSSAPTSLAAVTQSASRIALSWNAVSTATYYEIERDGVIVMATPTAATVIDDGPLIGSTLYTYRVRAANPAGTGPWSSSDSDTTSTATGSAFVTDFTAYSLGTDVGTQSGFTKEGTSTPWETFDPPSASALMAPADPSRRAVTPIATGTSAYKFLTVSSGSDGVIRSIFQIDNNASGSQIGVVARLNLGVNDGHRYVYYFSAGTNGVVVSRGTDIDSSTAFMSATSVVTDNTWYGFELGVAGATFTAKLYAITDFETPIWQAADVDTSWTGSGTWGLAHFADTGEQAADWLAVATDGAAIADWPGGNVTITAELWENGSFRAALGTIEVGTASIYEVFWDAADLVSLTGADVELRLTAPAGFDVDAIEWNAVYEQIVASGVLEYWGLVLI